MGHSVPITTKRSGPKVVFIGGEDVRLRIPLLLQLRRRGFDVAAIGSDEAQPFGQSGIPYATYPLNRSVHPLDDVRAMRRTRELFRELQPVVVHAFDTKPGMLAPSVAKACGVRVRVRTITGMGYVFSSNAPLALALRPIYRALQRRAARAATHTIFQNTDDQAYFLKTRLVDENRQTLVRGSGIDVEEIERRRADGTLRRALLDELDGRDRVIVTMVARLVRSKGVREFLRAASLVRRQFPNALFLLVGPRATEKSEAVSAAEIAAHTADVKYIGPRQDVPELLSVSDICVLPSYYREGVPRVLLEAAALGLPLIAADMPGCRDVAIHGVTGSLVRPRDAQALGQAIAEMVADPSARREMGRAARERVRAHFALDAVADAYAEIYRKSLQRTDSRSRRAA